MNQVSSAAKSVTVVTATYNRADVLQRAIRAVQDQSWAPLEHLVVDDGSTDNTSELLQELCREIPHLRYVRQKRQGAGVARNQGIEAAAGSVIAFLDSDDIWLPRKLERQVRFMEDKEAVFTYGDFLVQNRLNGKTFNMQPAPKLLSYRDLLGDCPIGCLTAAYDQEALGKVYMPLVKRGQDWGLWLALTRTGVKARKYPGVEAVYVCGGDSLSAKKLRKGADMYRIYRNYEQLGRLRSLWHLSRHTFNAMGSLSGASAYCADSIAEQPAEGDTVRHYLTKEP